MSTPGTIVNRLLLPLGLRMSRRDRLEEQIPDDYLKSPLLPRLYRTSLSRLFYFNSMFERIGGVDGDIVECGVSTGYGILTWALLCDLAVSDRHIWGFDSFEGFPPATEADRKGDSSFEVQPADWSSPPELVMKVLEDGRVTPERIATRIHLVPGFFEFTLHKYTGEIALLHLDCDLFQSYKVCLESLYERVRPGGVIMFDEYEDANFPGARQAIDAFFAGKPERLQTYDKLQFEKTFVVKL